MLPALPPLRVYAVVVAISFSAAFQVAYLLLLLNPLQATFEGFIYESFRANYGRPLLQWQFRIIYALFVNSATVGGIFAGIGILKLPNRIGRIRTFWICNASCTVGFSLCAVSKYLNRFELYIVGRLLNGFGAIMMYALQSMYFTEIADKKYRGFLNGQTGLFKTVGQVVALIVGMPIVLGTPNLWPLVHWLQFSMTFCLSLALLFAPESPKHLLANNEVDKCIGACRFCFGEQADTEQIMKRMRLELGMTKRRLSMPSFKRIKELRRGLIVGCVVNVMVAVSGIVAINFFAVYILQSAGLDVQTASWVAVGFGCVGIAGASLCVFCLDSLGRRTILLASAVAKCILNTVVMVGLLRYQRSPSPTLVWLVIGAMALLKFFLEGGTMQVSAFIASELVPQNTKALAQGSCTIVRYVSMSLVTLIFFPLDGLVGPWSFLLFIVPLAVTTVYAYFNLPETKVRDAQEVYDQYDELPKPKAAWTAMTAFASSVKKSVSGSRIAPQQDETAAQTDRPEGNSEQTSWHSKL